jgi:ATP-dependent Clp protease ATP-binding subunit ClpA
MIAQELEVSLHMAFVAAREKRHTVITVEHLLLALLDNPAVGQALRACGANIEALRQNLTEFVDTLTPVASGERDPDTQPNSGFQRVIQRAILQVQSTPSKEVTSTDVLRALFGEKDCHAELLLRQQHITALDVLNYVSHGITKAPQAQPDRAAEAPSPVASEPHSVPIDRPIQRELEVILHMAFVEARQKRHSTTRLPAKSCVAAAPTWTSCARCWISTSPSTRRSSRRVAKSTRNLPLASSG